MKSKIMFVLVLAGLAVSARAQSLNVSGNVVSEYVGPSGSAYHEGPAFQTEAIVSVESGAYVGLWASRAFEGELNDTLGDELDLLVGWEGEYNGFGLGLELAYYDEPTIGTFGKDDIWYFNIEVNRDVELQPIGDVNAFVKYESYVTTPGTEYEGGTLYTVGLSKEQSSGNATMTITEALTYDDGGFGLDKGLIFKLGLDVSWQVSDNVSILLPGIAFFGPFTEDEREKEIVGTIGLSYELQ